MPTTVKMPQLGETVVEGKVARWLKAPGEMVTKLEPLLEITTDKIDTEVPAPASGVLLEIVTPEGKTVRAGATLAYIGEPNDQVREANAIPATALPTLAVMQSAPKLGAAIRAKPGGRAFVSPVVGRIAAEHQIDLSQVLGTGFDGRITKKDILAYVERLGGQKDSEENEENEESKRVGQAESPISSLQSPIPRLPSPVSTLPSPADEILQPFTAMRRAIAQHMVQSKQTSPHVTTVFEVDMIAVVQHRERYKAAYGEKGIKLTFTPYFVAATATALQQIPAVNSRFTDAGIALQRRIHIGVAVALNQGLIVPVIRDADEKNLQGLARAVNELGERARNGSLPPDAVKGGTFTITNHGVTGSLIGTPIINQPQAAILGIGAIVKRPVVRSSSASLMPSADDALVIRPMCYLSFTFDHRLLDGAQADAFLTVIKETLENWRVESD
jgi:2-oxoglutarate dehydrogenase E2 component (dihydrolipoamide succinyltransferase)